MRNTRFSGALARPETTEDDTGSKNRRGLVVKTTEYSLRWQPILGLFVARSTTLLLQEILFPQ